MTRLACSSSTTVLGLIIIFGGCLAQAHGWQKPLQSSFLAGDIHNELHEAQASNFDFKRNITRVAIIGAGAGGLITFRELKNAGYNVRLLERDSVPGGNWRYTEDAYPSTPYPPLPLKIAEYTPSFPPKGTAYPYEETYECGEGGLSLEERIRDHSAPTPVWASLVSDVPAPSQQITEFPWPVDTPWELPHDMLARYLRAFASYHGANSNDENPEVSYSTRVEKAEKIEGNTETWKLTLKKLSREKGVVTARWWTENFDAVVVATGQYNTPSIARVPGLEAWKARWSNNIWHSRQYRRPEVFANKTVMVVGGGVSGVEITRDLAPHTKMVYVSSKSDSYMMPSVNKRFPHNAILIPEIASFVSPLDRIDDISQGNVELVNGINLSGVDHIIFATGYLAAYPFLPQYHDASLRANETAKGRQPIVTDGTHLRSLYLDLFYIEDPTLAFINMNTLTQTFIYAEYPAAALAKVWKGDAHIPSQKEMWRLYWDYVKRKGGHGRWLQSLPGKWGKERVRFFMEWLNAAPGRALAPPPHIATESTRYYTLSRFGFDLTAPPMASSFISPKVTAWGIDDSNDA
ncbi:hypothetical protein BOTBODRAFT_29394 [Botryobasidium botryosum FD-172 SS1]|uniref:FAD/NAD(P)-binding domain-containing protein n=1 Tax=Botryobasidium botryosum (strain FD-172 SS1) TaxID=930990 RepID=A0A067MQQ5_BOTB1|nr:hypothetical protein BOTBODRAFT_29394 [Botryobasidium botryosum FD-172 SS1]